MQIARPAPALESGWWLVWLVVGARHTCARHARAYSQFGWAPLVYLCSFYLDLDFASSTEDVAPNGQFGTGRREKRAKKPRKREL